MKALRERCSPPIGAGIAACCSAEVSAVRVNLTAGVNAAAFAYPTAARGVEYRQACSRPLLAGMANGLPKKMCPQGDTQVVFHLLSP